MDGTCIGFTSTFIATQSRPAATHPAAMQSTAHKLRAIWVSVSCLKTQQWTGRSRIWPLQPLNFWTTCSTYWVTVTGSKEKSALNHLGVKSKAFWFFCPWIAKSCGQQNHLSLLQLLEKGSHTLEAETSCFYKQHKKQNLSIVCDDKTKKWCLCPREGNTSSARLTATGPELLPGSCRVFACDLLKCEVRQDKWLS